VCIGRVTRQKGQDFLLAAWPRVRARCPDATLAIVGPGDPLPSSWQDLPDGVVFTGPMEDTRPWYAAADVVVLPSRWEGMPLTLLEALAVGRPVVGTDIPGIADSLPSGCGTVVPPGDIGALADAITYRIRRPEVARAEGAAGARYAARQADVRRTHAALAAVTAALAHR
jgi:glycosyltransferase involved in cell wall biosynthesis